MPLIAGNNGIPGLVIAGLADSALRFNRDVACGILRHYSCSDKNFSVMSLLHGALQIYFLLMLSKADKV